MLQVVVNEAGDEEIAVVVAGLQAQRQRMTGQFGRLLQGFRLELGGQKIIAITLIDQQWQLLVSLGNQLKPESLVQAAKAAGHPLELRMQPGYDHSYYFIASFIEDHLRHHARALAG